VSRIFFSAGESSGDLHGANLIRALRAADPTLECVGVGGQRMAEAGMTLRYDLAGSGIMGFTEVVKAFASIRRVFLDTAAYIEASRPDCLVLIDYPGFNIRLAERAKAAGVRVVYYISPQVWAWKKKRIYTLARLVEKMLVILPFEEGLYREIGVDCTYVGHPLLDHLASIEFTGEYRGECVIALLPGSREQEIRRLLGVMLEVARGIQTRYPEARFVTPCVDAVRERQVRAVAGKFPIETVVGQSYEVLSAARFGLVASGTATLEAALLGVPMAILYKVTALNHWIARRLVHVEHIGLANILAGKSIVPEFIQHEARSETVLPVALDLIAETPRRAQMIKDLAEVRAGLGDAGASDRAAQQILEVITNYELRIRN